MILLFIPGGMTPILQVMDLTVDVAFKKHICSAFEVYLHASVKEQRQQGKAWKDITFDLRMKVIRKPVDLRSLGCYLNRHNFKWVEE